MAIYVVNIMYILYDTLFINYSFFFFFTEQLTDFIWTTLLDPVAYRAHRLNETIKKQLDNDLTRRK